MHSAQIRVRNGNVDALGGPLGDKFSGTKPTGPLFFTTRAPKLQKLPTHSPIFPGWGHTREMNLSMCTRGTGPPTGQNTEETANTNPDKTQIDPSKHLVRFVRRLGLECVDGGEAVKCHTKTRAIEQLCNSRMLVQKCGIARSAFFPFRVHTLHLRHKQKKLFSTKQTSLSHSITF